MTDFERGGSPEMASEADLMNLFYSARAWLSIPGNGEVVDERHSPVLGTYYADGLPITNSMPFAEFTADGNLIGELLPEAAATLELGSSFSLRFDQAYYIPHTQGAPLYDRHDADCMFTVEKEAGAEFLADSIFVTQVQPAKVPESWAITHVFEPDDVLSAIRRKQTLTAAECASLQQIVDHLDQIKATQDARPPEPPVATD